MSAFCALAIIPPPTEVDLTSFFQAAPPPLVVTCAEPCQRVLRIEAAVLQVCQRACPQCKGQTKRTLAVRRTGTQCSRSDRCTAHEGFSRALRLCVRRGAPPQRIRGLDDAFTSIARFTLAPALI